MPQPARSAGNRPRLAQVLLVASAFVMEQLDGTIVANAAPSMAADLRVAPARIGVTMTAYLVTLAALIPLSGWVADRFGTRRVFVFAVTLFTLASGLCAMSPDLAVLVGMRVAQAAGGALMVPVGRLLVLGATEKKDLIRTIAYLTWPALVAPILAPVLAGIFTTYLTWRWIFLVNVPIGMIVLVWALIVLPRGRRRATRKLDVCGVAGTLVCFSSLTYLGASLAQPQVPILPAAVTAAVALASGVLTVAHLLRASAPLLRLRLLRVRTFRLAHAGGSLFRLTVLGLPFLLPLLFQVGFGWSPIKAGLVVLFVFAGNIAIKPATTPLLRRFGFRGVLLATVATMSVSIAGCAVLTGTTPLAAVAAVLAIGGVARSVGFSAYNTIAFSDVPAAEMSAANTLASTIQQLALGLGIAVGSVALRIGDAVGGSVPASNLTPYRIAFALLALITASALLEVRLLPRDAGAAVGGGTIRSEQTRSPAELDRPTRVPGRIDLPGRTPHR